MREDPRKMSVPELPPRVQLTRATDGRMEGGSDTRLPHQVLINVTAETCSFGLKHTHCMSGELIYYVLQEVLNKESNICLTLGKY